MWMPSAFSWDSISGSKPSWSKVRTAAPSASARMFSIELSPISARAPAATAGSIDLPARTLSSIPERDRGLLAHLRQLPGAGHRDHGGRMPGPRRTVPLGGVSRGEVQGLV